VSRIGQLGARGEDDAAGGGEDEHAGHAAARAETVEQEAAYRGLSTDYLDS
jgi:hypothetical protein